MYSVCNSQDVQSDSIWLFQRKILFLQKIIFAKNNFMEFLDRFEETAELKRVLNPEKPANKPLS